MTHDGAEQQRQQQDAGQTVEDEQESRQESHSLARLQQRKDGGNQQRDGKRGEQHEGGHLREVAAELARHDGRGGSAGGDDTHQHGLKQKLEEWIIDNGKLTMRSDDV